MSLKQVHQHQIPNFYIVT